MGALEDHEDVQAVHANFDIPDEEMEKIRGTRILIVNALRKEKHISHFNLEEALEVIQKIKPEKAYLTHLSHAFGKHKEIQKELPVNVFVAYDGLKLIMKYMEKMLKLLNC